VHKCLLHSFGNYLTDFIKLGVLEWVQEEQVIALLGRRSKTWYISNLWQCHLFVQFVLCRRVGQLFLYFISPRVIPQQPLELEEPLVLTFYWWGRVRLREVKWLGQDLLIALSLQENSFFLEIIIFLVFSPLHPSWCDFVFPHSSIMYFNQGVI